MDGILDGACSSFSGSFSCSSSDVGGSGISLDLTTNDFSVGGGVPAGFSARDLPHAEGSASGSPSDDLISPGLPVSRLWLAGR